MIRSLHLCFFLLLFSSSTIFAQCVLPKPDSVSVTSWTSCDATLSWDTMPDATYYMVRYKFDNGTDVWTDIPTEVTATSYTFTNLSSDRAYKFSVSAYCDNTVDTLWKQDQKVTEKVTKPESVVALNMAGTSLLLAWENHCHADNNNIRYRDSLTQVWTIVKNVVSTEYLVSGLVPGSLYYFQVQAQNGMDTSKWTTSLAVNSGVALPVIDPQPNMIIYMIDDGRYDPFQLNGGPAWFNTPSISRIANEGINFVYSFPTTSQCAPSRASIYTGLYASHHGTVDNKTPQFEGIPLVQQMLHDAGYYTGFVGKYGQAQGYPKGFDWWATSYGNIYTDATYKINGKDTTIVGHLSDVYQDLATTFLNSVPEGKKFCLMYFTRVPHGPTIPRPEDMDLYTNESLPLPDNFYKYEYNYPSFLYKSGHNWDFNEAETDSVRKNDFRCLYGAEVNVTGLFDWLTNKGILDSTFLLFTSDNGFLKGEHMLSGKQLAHEESIRVPLFIRYPAWFDAGQVNTDVMALNIDIPVTLLDLAGIPDTAGMDGVSLRQLYSGEIKRKYFYYQLATDAGLPAIRAVRSTQYKYVKAYCEEFTAEFYDLMADPEENINQINNPDYGPLIQIYREALDSIKTTLEDADPLPTDCYLSNLYYPKEADEEMEALNLKNVEVYPNPSSQYFTMSFNDEQQEDMEVWITNLLNENVFYKHMPNTNAFNVLVNAQGWAPGLYMVHVKKADRFYSRKFTIQK